MNEIRALVMNEPLFETHTHQQGCAAHDWERKTFDEFIAYGTADLATAGAPFEASVTADYTDRYPDTLYITNVSITGLAQVDIPPK